MKKVLGKIFAIILLCAGVLCFPACDSFSANFKQTELVMFVGEEKNIYSYVEQELTPEQQDKILFSTRDNTFAVVTFDNKISALKAGKTNLDAYYDGELFASLLITVKDYPVILQTPTGLKFNNSNGTVEWNYTYYEKDSTTQLFPYYDLEIIKDNGTPEVKRVADINSYKLTDAGSYKVRVKASPNANTDFIASEFSSYIEFTLTYAPTTLQFNFNTKTLVWNSNGNDIDTKYVVKYSINGDTIKSKEVSSTSLTFEEDILAGTHTFQVVTVPKDNSYMANSSEVLTITKLHTPQNFEFYNGEFSFDKDSNAKEYKVTVKFGQEVLSTFTLQNTSELTITSDKLKQLCVTPGDYSMVIQSIGNDETIFSSAESNVFNFTKLPKARVVFNESTRHFVITNATLGETQLFLIGNENEFQNPTTIDFSQRTDNILYSIKANMIAEYPTYQIDGGETDVYTVSGSDEELKYIKNLTTVILSYYEKDGDSIISVGQADLGCKFELFKLTDSAPTSLGTSTETKFNLGQTVSVFGVAGKYSYAVKVSKDNAEDTKFLSTTTLAEIVIEKLISPTTLEYNNNNKTLSIVDELPEGATQCGYKVNGADVATLDETLSKWIIQAYFIADTLPKDTTAQIPQYYTSSGYTNFTIERVEKVTDITYDYQSKCFNFVDNDVDKVNKYVISKPNIPSQTFGIVDQKYFVSSSGIYEGDYSIVSIAKNVDGKIQITSSQTGFIDSLPASISVYKVGEATALKFNKETNGQITLSWTAPESFDQDLRYVIYKKYADNEGSDGLNALSYFTKISDELVDTSYTFDKEYFDKVGQYTFKILVKSPDGVDKKFFNEENPNESIRLVYLKQANKIKVTGDQNNKTNYQITIDETTFSGVSTKLSNILIKTKIVNANNETILENSVEQTNNIFSVNLNNGDTLEVKATYLGLFNSDLNVYYLDANESIFTTKKLSAITSVSLSNMSKTNGYAFDFSWISPDVESGIVPSYMKFNCLIENTTLQYPSSQLFINNVSHSPTGDMGFLVKAVSSSTWTEISNGSTQYLDCDTYTKCIVPKEQTVTNVEVCEVDDKVIISWNYTPCYEIDKNVYIPSFNCALKNSSNEVVVNEKISTLEDGIPTLIESADYRKTAGAFYELRINSSKFSAGNYTLNISVSQKDTIDSSIKSISIHKLKTISNIQIVETETMSVGTFMTANGAIIENISDYGLDKIEVLGGEQLSQSNISGKDISLSNVNDSEDCSVTVRLKAKVNSQSESFFLNGEPATFRFVKITPTTIQIQDRELTWENKNVEKYLIRYNTIFGNSTIIASQNSLPFSQVEVMAFEAGDYNFAVKAVVTHSTPYTSDTDIPLSSEYSSDFTVTKLAKVQNIQVGKTSASGDDITISWSEVTGANSYEIYVAKNNGNYALKYVVEDATSYVSSGWFDEVGTYTIKIIASAENCFKSTLSDDLAKVGHLGTVDSLKVSKNYNVQFNKITQLQSESSDFIAGYKISILDSNNVIQFSTTINELNYVLPHTSSDDFLKTLDSGFFKVQIQILGTISTTPSAVATIDGEVSNRVSVYKLKAPSISIIDNKIVVTDSNDAELTYNNSPVVPSNYLMVQKSDDLTNYLYNGISSQYTISAFNSSYVVNAYSTVGDGIFNIVESSWTNASFDALSKPVNLVLKNTNGVISGSWNTVTNATFYEVYVSQFNESLGSKVIISQQNMGSTTNSFEFPMGMFDNAGKYFVKIRAISTDKVYSDYSDEVQVVRLSAVSGSYVLSDNIVYLNNPHQDSTFYSIYLDVFKDDALQIKTSTNLAYDTLTYDGFSSWMQGAEDGVFYVNIKLIGNDASNMAGQVGVMTLSSTNTQIEAYKLAGPSEVFHPSFLSSALFDASVMFNGDIIDKWAQVQYSIYSDYTNEVYALNELGSEIVNYSMTNFTYPNAWTAGVYTVVAKAIPKNGVRNILISEVVVEEATRLPAPDNLGFIRSEVTDSTRYFFDGDTAPTFLSAVLNFEFDTVEHASVYKISNGLRFYDQAFNTNSIPLVSENAFESFVYENTMLKVIASPSEGKQDGVVYIDSTAKEIYFAYLPVVQNFRTQDGMAIWNTVENAQTYLIYAMQTGSSKYNYWQASNQNINSSYLTDIVDGFEGEIYINIKAVGNVGEESRQTSNIYLDGLYQSRNKSVTKLAKVNDLSVDQGLITFTKVENAESYAVLIYDEDNSLINSQNVILQSYGKIIGFLENEDTFIGFSDVLANLPTDKIFKLKVQAQSKSTDVKNYLYSDLSNEIKIQVLQDVNSGKDFTLTNDTDKKLNKKFISVNVNKKASGVWVLFEDHMSAYDSSKVIKVSGEFDKFPYVPEIKRGGDLTYAFASMGSSTANDDGVFYLNSLFTTYKTRALDKTTISINDGIISWTDVDDADGYYVYINEQLINGTIYRDNYIILGDSYAGVENNIIDIKVIAVTGEEDLSKLCSPETKLEITHTIDNNTQSYNFVSKLHAPSPFDVKDGSLVWNNGIVGLNDYNDGEFVNLINTAINYVATLSAPTMTIINSLNEIDEFLESVFNTPLTMYSRYSGFNPIVLEATLEDKTNAENKFTFDIGADKFLRLSTTQKHNLQQLLYTLETKASGAKTDILEILEKEEVGKDQVIYKTIPQVFSSIREYAASRFFAWESFTKQEDLIDILLGCENNDGLPNSTVLFDNINAKTESMPSGYYYLTIVQKGNDFDWLDSGVSVKQEIYVPNAPSEVEIVMTTTPESDDYNNFYIEWEKVSVPNGYSSTYFDETLGRNVTLTESAVYILYGDDKYGNRIELLRTCGINAENNTRLRIDLTALIEQDILNTSITKIWLVVAGNDFTLASSSVAKIINGKSTKEFNISVLNQLSPSIEKGELKLQNDIASAGFEITTNIKKEVITDSLWSGNYLNGGSNYDIKVRLVGKINGEDENKNYVLTGKSFSFKVGKLNMPIVSVNEFGLFTWSEIANATAYMPFINNQKTTEIIENSYETKTAEYSTYKFMAVGDTNTIENNTTIYYLNSSMVSEIFAVMLSSVDNVYIEEGLIKWTPLNLATEQNISVNLDGTQKVGYRLTFNDGQVFNTTNTYFDLTNYGIAKSDYNVLVQAYIYFDDNSVKTVGQTRFGNKNYVQVLGQAFNESETVVGKNFEMIFAPTGVRILNGEFVWDYNSTTSYVPDEYYYEVYLDGKRQRYGHTSNKFIWPGDTLLYNVNYTFKVKAYKENAVFSNFALYQDNEGQLKTFTRLNLSNKVFDEYKDYDGNHIKFAFSEQNFDYAFALRYQIPNTDEFYYVKVTDSNYYDIVKITPTEVDINISKLQLNSSQLEIDLQLVPLNETQHLSSNYIHYSYSVPNSIKEVLFDDVNEEYYFFRVDTDNNPITNGFMITDEILDNNGNLLATYIYTVPSGSVSDLETKDYFDAQTNKIKFTPTVVGYNHRVSVAVVSNNEGNNPFMSSPVMANVIYGNNEFVADGNFELFKSSLFNSSVDLFSDIESYLLLNANEQLNYFTNYAYGSEQNPYLINSKEDFENINKRLTKYSYLNSYKLKIQGISETIDITDTLNAFVFLQNIDELTDVTTMIGYKTSTTSGVIYSSFNNIYDGNNGIINYSLNYNGYSDSTDRTGLFKIIGTLGVVKNLNVNALFDFANLPNASFDMGGLASYNYGKISNVTILNITIQNMVNDGVGLLNVNFGGVVSQNYGSVFACVNKSQSEIAIEITNKMSESTMTQLVVYAGGISAKNYGEIQNCLNEAMLNVTSRYALYVGGITGENNGEILTSKNSAIIQAICTNSSSNAYIGGIAGINTGNGKITGALSKGEVIAENNELISNVYAGGICGHSANFNLNGCYSAVPNIVIAKDNGIINKVGGAICGTMGNSLQIQGYMNYYVNGDAFMNQTIYADFTSTNIQDMLEKYSTYYKLIGGVVSLYWEK